jgi:hypothetical protein
MKLERVQPGDVVRCAIKGRTSIYGEVTEIKDGIVYFRPLCPATGWRHASAREVVGHATRRRDLRFPRAVRAPRRQPRSTPPRPLTVRRGGNRPVRRAGGAL